MSRIDQLISELAPQGVAHVSISEVAGYSDTRVNASELDETNFVGVDNLLPNKSGKVDASYLPNTARLTAYEVGDILLGNIRPYLKKVWLATDAGGCSGDVLAVRIVTKYREAVDPEFLYYLLSSDGFFAYNMQNAKGAKMPRGNKEAILNYRIPVPPIEVQREIVRILDQFTQLEAELEAELEARRHQYEHYREDLLTADISKSVRAQLDKLFDLRAGRFIAASDIVPELDDEHPIPCFGGGGLRGYVTSPNQQGDLVLIGRQGALCGNVKRASGEFYATEHSVVVTPKEGVNIRWAFHLLASMNLNQYASKSAQPGLAVGTLNKLVVDVPSLHEQTRVGSILDKFDILVNDLSIGLPAELVARRKQYEYYRDRLLTFEEAAA